MIFYMKEWANKSVTLMTEDGVALSHFASAKEAREILRDWYSAHEGEVQYHIGFLHEAGTSECEVA